VTLVIDAAPLVALADLAPLQGGAFTILPADR
jgi:hypothetical protein